MKNPFLKFITQLFRIIVGGLFIFSGIVKAIDVQGTAYKLEEYFEIFGWHFFEEHSVFIATVFVLLEIMLGVLLLLGIKKNITLTLLLGTIIFFSFLTYYSAANNAVTDCGCFGDFIKLEPWDSFYKDLALMAMIIVLIIGKRFIKPLFRIKTSNIIVAIAFLISSYVAWHGLYRLPLVDFRPFAVGEDIREGLAYKDAKKAFFYNLQNLKTGKDTVVNSIDYMDKGLWKDTLNYKYIDAIEDKDSIIEPGIPAKIKNFEIIDPNDNEIKDQVLEATELMLIIYPDDTQYCTVGEDNIKKLIDQLKQDDPQMEYLTLASHQNVLADIPSAVLDDSTMKQMIRSNPGVIFLKKGIVVAKYHYNALPKNSETIINLYK